MKIVLYDFMRNVQWKHCLIKKKTRDCTLLCKAQATLCMPLAVNITNAKGACILWD